MTLDEEARSGSDSLRGACRGSAVSRRLLRAIATTSLAAGAADGCHMRAIAAHRFAALAACNARFVRGELVGPALRMRGLAALAGDLALLAKVHRGKSAVALGTVRIALYRHRRPLLVRSKKTHARRTSPHRSVAPLRTRRRSVRVTPDRLARCRVKRICKVGLCPA